MSEEVVTRRSGKRIESKAKRWSAPPSEKGFSPAINTPDQITRDVRGLKLRQRVSIVLGDEVLREELEEVVGNVDITNKTTNLQSFRTYQDFLIPTGSLAGGGRGVPVTPIADIRGMDTIKLSKEERLLRCKVAAVYRLALEFSWATSDYDQVFCTARSTEDDYYYLTSPMGMLFNEITAGSLIKMDLEGNTVEPGTTNFCSNKLADQVHCIVYEALKDINCVMCLTSMAVKAVSAMECGLLPISKDAVAVGEVTYYSLSGVGFDKEDKEDLINKCEGVDKVLFLRNVGAICIGKSVEEAVYVANLLNQACQYQINAMRAGIEHLVHIDKDVRKKIYQSLHDEADDANQNKRKNSSILFDAWMRMLDSKGNKTGYEYSTEVFKREPPPSPSKTTKAKTPAKASSFRYEQQSRDRNPVRRAHTTGRAYNRTKLKWLNEPVKSTEYKKEPNLELPNIETVIFKDREPEKSDKDAREKIIEESIGVKVEAVSESAPTEAQEVKVVETTEGPTKTTVTTVVTTVETAAEDEAKEKADEAKEAEDKLLSPEGDSGHGKKRKKVKKSRSFKDALKETFGKKKTPEKSKEKHSDKAAEKKSDE